MSNPIVIVDGKPLDISQVDFSQLDVTVIDFKIYDIAQQDTNFTTISSSEQNGISLTFIEKYENKNYYYWSCISCNTGNLASILYCTNCNKKAPKYIISLVTAFELMLREINNYFTIEHLTNLQQILLLQKDSANKFIMDNIIKNKEFGQSDIILHVSKLVAPFIKFSLENVIINKDEYKYANKFNLCETDLTNQYNIFINNCIMVYSNYCYIEYIALNTKK